ncbi:hypothetical protein GYMLUDRAFT_56930 [Collybiopsis luxurians FD-317 M1]|nr:hypothetical protein GYMLUDRAFT_56930 [Collybiopsis luxurians FD-317 M1]
MSTQDNDGDDRMSGHGVPSWKRGRSPSPDHSHTKGQVKGKGCAEGGGPESAGPSHRQGSRQTAAEGAGPSSAPNPWVAGPAHKKAQLAPSRKKATCKSKLSTKQKKSLHFHIRLLWGLFSRKDVPPLVSTAVIERFNECFTTADKEQLDTLLNSAQATTEGHATAQEIWDRAFLADGTTARNLHCVSDFWLDHIFSGVHAVGLEKWAPDVCSHPSSLYNTVHAHIALSTYCQLLSGHAYNFLVPDMSMALKHDLCEQIYEHFVFHYIGKKQRDEARKPGTTQQRAALNNVYCQRGHRDEARKPGTTQQRAALNNVYCQRGHIKSEGFRPQVLQLALETEAHSDDESDSSSHSNVYYTRPEVGHHPKIPVDCGMSNWSTCQRAVHVCKNGVALPLEEDCEDVTEWKNLSEDDFMDLYGNDVLKQYNIPTAEEIAQLDEYETDGSGGGEAEGSD